MKPKAVELFEQYCRLFTGAANFFEVGIYGYVNQ